jgi:anti-sigma28 factor (negative regulator of flagellin synthesis)
MLVLLTATKTVKLSKKKASNLEGETTQVSQQGDHSKIDSLKESIKNGDYQLNLRALAEKIADELV